MSGVEIGLYPTDIDKNKRIWQNRRLIKGENMVEHNEDDTRKDDLPDNVRTILPPRTAELDVIFDRLEAIVTELREKHGIRTFIGMVRVIPRPEHGDVAPEQTVDFEAVLLERFRAEGDYDLRACDFRMHCRFLTPDYVNTNTERDIRGIWNIYKEKGLSREFWDIMHHIVHNPNTPADVLEDICNFIFEHPDNYREVFKIDELTDIPNALLTHPNTPNAQRTELIVRNSVCNLHNLDNREVFIAIINREYTLEEVQDLLTREWYGNQDNIRGFIAHSRFAAEEAVFQLLIQNYNAIFALASNPHISDEQAAEVERVFSMRQDDATRDVFEKAVERRLRGREV